MKTQEKSRRKKSMMITLGVHASLLVLGMLPVAYQLEKTEKDELSQVIEIDFAEFAQSNNEALKAISQERDTEVKPVTEEVTEEPDIIEVETVEEITETTTETELLESDVTEDAEAEVVASDDSYEGEAEQDAVANGSESTLETGADQGVEEEGEGEGYRGLDGTGVITRKVVHREDITQVAHYSGVIAVNLCIDRRGRVTAVSKNDERTTITDHELVRKALDLAAGYRFETDYSAALRECGVLTFVFDIDEDNYSDYVMVE